MLAFDFVTTTTRIGILCIFFHLTGAARKWDYEPLLLPTTSSDESKLKFEAKIERLGRSDYGLSGIIEWKYDTNEETMVEAQAYRSNSGDESDYKLLPWAIPKQPFYDYLNTYYKDVILKNLGYCPNLPKYDGQRTPISSTSAKSMVMDCRKSLRPDSTRSYSLNLAANLGFHSRF